MTISHIGLLFWGHPVGHMSYAYPEKFIRDNVVAPFVPTSIAIVIFTLLWALVE